MASLSRRGFLGRLLAAPLAAVGAAKAFPPELWGDSLSRIFGHLATTDPSMLAYTIYGTEFRGSVKFSELVPHEGPSLFNRRELDRRWEEGARDLFRLMNDRFRGSVRVANRHDARHGRYRVRA